jgi:class 3 adenylate cyclase
MTAENNPPRDRWLHLPWAAPGPSLARFAVFAALSSLPLSAFGVQACPYLHGLGARGVWIVVVAAFVAVGLLRTPLEHVWVLRAPALDRPARQLALDFGLYVIAGGIVAVVDRVAFGFPLGSGARITAGFFTLGLFCALDGALLRERVIINGDDVGTRSDRYFSLSTKFAAVAMALFALVGVDLLLMSSRDLEVALRAAVATSTSPATPAPSTSRELTLEMAATLLLLLPLLVNLALTFAHNLRLVLDRQRLVLEAVAQGQLDVAVPVVSRDEFAVIATRTNEMIAGLREKRRVQQLVHKLASPAVAERVLKDDASLAGMRRRVVVLFSDVRNFTTRSEAAPPEELVADLNLYFTEMVAIVHAHGGVVDKFIGDGLMAIFGFGVDDDPACARAAHDAVSAARAMHAALPALNQRLSAPIAIGVGVHVGDAVAGTLGSPERLEFTFIGDTVNTAARIESMTKGVRASPSCRVR